MYPEVTSPDRSTGMNDPVNRDVQFMHLIPDLINTIAAGDEATATELKVDIRRRRLGGASWESVYRLLNRVAYPMA